mgnify:CR=1 FL=1|jgi:hypothetical protein|tara:strand:+ start:4031 stop:4144 length:114 start_codon:yes stop_codon:yes gene_type:complete
MERYNCIEVSKSYEEDKFKKTEFTPDHTDVMSEFSDK